MDPLSFVSLIVGLTSAVQSVLGPDQLADVFDDADVLICLLNEIERISLQSIGPVSPGAQGALKLCQQRSEILHLELKKAGLNFDGSRRRVHGLRDTLQRLVAPRRSTLKTAYSDFRAAVLLFRDVTTTYDNLQETWPVLRETYLLYSSMTLQISRVQSELIDHIRINTTKLDDQNLRIGAVM